MNVARTDTQAAAWNNPSWLSNKKGLSNPKDEEPPGGKEAPHWKKNTPSFMLEEDEEESKLSAL